MELFSAFYDALWNNIFLLFLVTAGLIFFKNFFSKIL